MASFHRMYYALSTFVNMVLICQWCSQRYEIYLIFKEFFQPSVIKFLSGVLMMIQICIRSSLKLHFEIDLLKLIESLYFGLKWVYFFHQETYQHLYERLSVTYTSTLFCYVVFLSFEYFSWHFLLKSTLSDKLFCLKEPSISRQ